MKKIISLILLGFIAHSCSSRPEDPIITPPGYSDIPKEEDIKKEREIKEDKNEELEQLKKLLLKN